MTRHTSRLVATTLLVPALIAAAGCPPKVGYRKGGIISRMVFNKRERQVEVTGKPITTGRFTAFDVDNPHGSVTIHVREGTPEAFIGARIRHELRHKIAAQREGWEYDHIKHWFTATHETSSGRGGETGIVTVRPTDQVLADGTRPFIDLWVETPVCDGLDIRSRYGNVTVVGLSGSVRIDAEGDIEVRTNEPLRGEIMLHSTDGTVTLVAPPGSTGTFLVSAPEGRASFTSESGRSEQVRPREGEWSGVFNRGTNPVTITSDAHDASVFIRPGGEMYTAPW